MESYSDLCVDHSFFAREQLALIAAKKCAHGMLVPLNLSSRDGCCGLGGISARCSAKAITRVDALSS